MKRIIILFILFFSSIASAKLDTVYKTNIKRSPSSNTFDITPNIEKKTIIMTFNNVKRSIHGPQITEIFCSNLDTLNYLISALESFNKKDLEFSSVSSRSETYNFVIDINIKGSTRKNDIVLPFSAGCILKRENSRTNI